VTLKACSYNPVPILSQPGQWGTFAQLGWAQVLWGAPGDFGLTVLQHIKVTPALNIVVSRSRLLLPCCILGHTPSLNLILFNPVPSCPGHGELRDPSGQYGHSARNTGGGCAADAAAAAGAGPWARRGGDIYG
jgi:hypothetical protein